MTLPGPFGTPSRPTAAILAAVAVLVVALLGAGLAQTGTDELRIPAAGTTTLLRLLVFTGLAVHTGEIAGRRLGETTRAPSSTTTEPGPPTPGSTTGGASATTQPAGQGTTTQPAGEGTTTPPAGRGTTTPP